MELLASEAEAAFEDLRAAQSALEESLRRLDELRAGLRETDELLQRLVDKAEQGSPAFPGGAPRHAPRVAPRGASKSTMEPGGRSWLPDRTPPALRKLATWVGEAGSAVANRLRPYWQRRR